MDFYEFQDKLQELAKMKKISLEEVLTSQLICRLDGRVPMNTFPKEWIFSSMSVKK